jgi:hypothetical protein
MGYSGSIHQLFILTYCSNLGPVSWCSNWLHLRSKAIYRKGGHSGGIISFWWLDSGRLGSFGGVWRCPVDFRCLIQAQFTSYWYLSNLGPVSWCSNWLHFRSKAIDRRGGHSGGIISFWWLDSGRLGSFGGVWRCHVHFRCAIQAQFTSYSYLNNLGPVFWCSNWLHLSSKAIDRRGGHSGGIISFWWLDSGRLGSCGGVWRCPVDFRGLIQVQFTSYSYCSNLGPVSWCSNWLPLRSKAIYRGGGHSGGIISFRWLDSGRLGSFGGVWWCPVHFRCVIQAQFTSYSYVNNLGPVFWCSNWLHLRSKAIDRGVIPGVSSHSGAC